MHITVEDVRKSWLWLAHPYWDWVKTPIQETLKMFDANPKTDLRSTPYFKISVWVGLGERHWWHGVKTEADCVRRTQEVLNLRRQLEREGIRNPITVQLGPESIDMYVSHVGRNGKIFVQDGYHRLFIADYINYKKAIPVVVSVKGQGFKAIENLMLKLGAGQKFTYHPLYDSSSALYHPYFRDWNSWRTDTPQRYRAILAKLDRAKSVLDIGACEGYFSINLAAKGYDVTAVELNEDRAKAMRFFADLRGVSFPIAVEDWQSYCARTDKEFDAAIFLSTFHHQVLNRGLEEFKKLGLIRAKKLFFEMACNKEPKMAKFPNLSNNEIVRRVLANTKFTHWEKIYTGQRAFALRDIFMFT